VRAAAAEKDVKLRAIVAAYQDEVTKGLEETRARLARDAEKELGLARGEMALRFLEVRDNLTRSLAAAAGGARPDALLAGLQLVVAQFDAALGALGLERIEAAGAPFDPALHEAVTLVADRDPARAGTVVAEIQAGYRLAGRVVRPARVAVGRLPS
jgi:molecular chaperone GrpE (heat shock protein)